MQKKYKRLLTVIGVIAACVAFVFGAWLILEMFGVPIAQDVFGLKLSLPDIIRWLAEITIGALLVAAIAFL